MATSTPWPAQKLSRRISIASRPRPFRVVLLGQAGVGKSALTVRFLTRRFIGDYDPYLEKVYTCTRSVDGETVVFEVLDTAVQQGERGLEESIRWADAYVLMYSVADRCSLNECLRLKFLINTYAKRSRKLSASSAGAGVGAGGSPVALVGNQNDRGRDRMVSLQHGMACAAQLGCVAFYETSVRESGEAASAIFLDLWACSRRPRAPCPLHPRCVVTHCAFTDDDGGGSDTADRWRPQSDASASTLKASCYDVTAKPEAEVRAGETSGVARRRGALQSIS